MADFTMSRPPIPPPEVPSLSAMPMMGSRGEEGGAPEGQSQALIKLMFEVSKTLDTIAKAIPSGSEEIQDIKDRLRTLMATALQQGANGKTSSNSGTVQSSMDRGSMMSGY